MSQTHIRIQAFIWSKRKTQKPFIYLLQRGYVLFSELIQVLCLI